MPVGRVVIAVGTAGESATPTLLALEVSLVGSLPVGRCTLAKSSDVIDVQCADELTATRLLLGPMPVRTVMALGASEAARCLDAWCPLPIHVAKQDLV